MTSRSNVRSYRISFDFYVTPAVKLLLIANFAVFLVEAFTYYFFGIGGYNWMLKWFGLVPAGVVPLLRIWQPVTYLFLHDVGDRFECLAAIRRFRKRFRHAIHDIGILWIDRNVREVERALIDERVARDHRPVIATVIGAPENALLGFDQRVYAVSVARCNR